MTYEEFKKVQFHWVGHLSMDTEHSNTYIDETGRLGVCVHTTKLKNGNFGKSKTHYRIDKHIYKSKDEFITALEKFSDIKYAKAIVNYD